MILFGVTKIWHIVNISFSSFQQISKKYSHSRSLLYKITGYIKDFGRTFDISSSEHTILIANKYMFYEWISISLTVNKYIISLKLNKYNSLKLHKYTVAGCKIMPWVQSILFDLNICISWILHQLQTANHSQLWMVTQTNTDYDLLVLCITCEQRPLAYHEKQRLLVSLRQMFMCPYNKSAIIIEICFFNFTRNLRSRL